MPDSTDVIASSKNIKKYLDRYAEPEASAQAIGQVEPFHSILVVPIYDESIESLRHFVDLRVKESYALVLVFNVPDDAIASAQGAAALDRTQKVMQRFIDECSLKQAGHYWFVKTKQGHSVYVLDRVEKPIPAKQGVGLARKVGMDFALQLAVNQAKQHAIEITWVHSTDADVELPPSYFEVSQKLPHEPGISGLVYPFIHAPETGYERAISLYEFSLRYYVKALEYAGSPYAFHTIGSLIAVNVEAYASVRGIPKRSGGEDFYLLNKLAKIGKINTLEAPVIKVRGRPSARVPFGTGPALTKIKSLEKLEEEYTFYHPKIFDLLKCVLDIISDTQHNFASIDLFFKAIEARINNEKDAALVINALSKLKVRSQFEHLSTKKDSRSFAMGFHIWFDAFITLRFVHTLRDLGLENVRFDQLDERYKLLFRELV